MRSLITDIVIAADSGLYDTFDATVLKRITATNEDFLPGGMFYDRLAELLTREKRPSDYELFTTGIDIGARIGEDNKTPRNIILGYMNAALWMDTLKTGFNGPQSTGKVHYGIGDYMRKQVIDLLPLDVKTHNLMKVMGSGFVNMRESNVNDNHAIDMLLVKMNNFDREYQALREFKTTTLDYYGNAEELSPEEFRVIDRNVRLLNQESMAHRKYGTKPAYTEASIGGSWIFYDGEDYRESLLRDGTNILLPHFASVVIHSPHTDLQNINLDATRVRTANALIRQAGNDMPSAEPDFAVIIAFDGTMSVDAHGLQTVDRALKDSPRIASMLKAEVAANFYDLSMPIDTNAASELKSYVAMSTVERQNFDPILQLLMPRMRYLGSSAPPSPETIRTVREHDVTWFVRKLREGWHPSPDAIANAARVGIVLDRNETFVRAHKRGAGHAVIGYHAVKREIDLQPGIDY